MWSPVREAFYTCNKSQEGVTGAYVHTPSNRYLSRNLLIAFSASINNPIRSSLKKPKNKETASVASGMSKKSVRIALGEEMTAV